MKTEHNDNEREQAVNMLQAVRSDDQRTTGLIAAQPCGSLWDLPGGLSNLILTSYGVDALHFQCSALRQLLKRWGRTECTFM